jgi:hypothetical protein
MADEAVVEAAPEAPEALLTTDETAALTQLYSVDPQPLRLSSDGTTNDFTGIGSTSGLYASLARWHATNEVNGLIRNDAGPATLLTAWKLTYIGLWFAANQGITKSAPAITSLAPATASIAAQAGHPVTVTVNGTSFRSGQVVQVGGVAQTTTYVSGTQLIATYTLPATAQTVQFAVNDPITSQTSANSPFVVAA